MEIYDLLKKDHKKVQDILKELKEKKESKEQDGLILELKKELTVHMDGEEKLLYPVLEKEGETREKTLESIEEHHVTKIVLKELLSMSQTDDKWAAKLSVLKELVDHHIEEEEKELFKQAKKVLKKEQAQDIAEQFTKQKGKKMASMK